MKQTIQIKLHSGNVDKPISRKQVAWLLESIAQQLHQKPLADPDQDWWPIKPWQSFVIQGSGDYQGAVRLTIRS